MELKWMLDFVSLANTGSFSKAAAERNVTQSAFSRRIRSLEDWLGTDLVDRKSYPITLTASGMRFVETAERMIKLLYRVREDFGGEAGAQRRVLTFSVATNLAINFFPEWLQSVERETGQVAARVLTDVSGIHAHFETLQQQEADFLLHYAQSIDSLAVDSSKYEKLVIGEDVLLPVCQTELAGREQYALPGTPDRPLPYVSPWHSSSLAKIISASNALEGAVVYLDDRVHSSIVGCTKGLVLQGFGFAWLPRSAIKIELEANLLTPIGDSSYHIPISIEIYRYVSNNRADVVNFWDILSSATDHTH